MPKRNLIYTSDFPYHITARSNNREWFYTAIENAWDILIDQSKNIIKKFSVKIHAFVLMHNHYHMLITTPQENLGKVMNEFQREVAREINKIEKRINHVFGGPYRWSIVDNQKYLYHVLRYIYQNPVRANLAESTFFR